MRYLNAVSVLGVVLVVGTIPWSTGCKGHAGKSRVKGGSVTAAGTGAAVDATEPAADAGRKAKAPPSKYEDLRETIKSFAALLEECDKRFFADVKGERIKKWKLPVDVQAMEDRCDPLLMMVQTMIDKGAFLHRDLDSFLVEAANAADRYMMLAFRAKKIGVREKKPYIRRVNDLRDKLRADTKRLSVHAGQVLGLTDDELEARAHLKPKDLVMVVFKTLLRLGDAVSNYVRAPMEKKHPTWRYSLKAWDRIAQRAVQRLRTSTPPQAQALLGPAEALLVNYGMVVTFFTGDWFNQERKQVKRVLTRFRHSFTAFKRAGVRALKLTHGRTAGGTTGAGGQWR